MFSLCEAMKWNHLPGSGRLYDQDPLMIDKWLVIWSERSKHQERERRAQESRSKAKK